MISIVLSLRHVHPYGCGGGGQLGGVLRRHNVHFEVELSTLMIILKGRVRAIHTLEYLSMRQGTKSHTLSAFEHERGTDAKLTLRRSGLPLKRLLPILCF